MGMKENKRRKMINHIGLVLLLAVSFIILIWVKTGRTEELSFDNETAFDFMQGWYYLDEQGNQVPAEIPGRIKNDGNVTVISREYPNDLNEKIAYAPVLGFRSSHQKIRVFVDKNEIYSFGHEEHILSRSGGSVWNLVRLPKDLKGAEITIESVSCYKTYDGLVNPIYIGSKAALLFKIIKMKLFPFCISILILLFGVILLLCWLFLNLHANRKQSNGRSALYLGIFALLMAIWNIGESQLIQFVSGDILFFFTITFMAVLLLPIPLVKYLMCMETFGFKKSLTWMIRYLYAQFVILTGLQIFGILDYMESIVVAHIAIGIGSALLMGMLCYDYVRCRNKGIQYTIFSVLCLGVFGVLEIIWFYIGDGVNSGNYVKVGVLLFIVLQAYWALKRLLHMYEMSKDAGYYERLAMRDGLTRCLNRHAYENRVEENELTPNTAIVMIDINNLKTINDCYGHAYGDDAIMRCADILHNVIGSFGECYRLGGDEFLIWSDHLTEKKICELMIELELLCRKENALKEYDFNIAYGWAVYNPHMDGTIADTVKRADQNMYECKERQKAG